MKGDLSGKLRQLNEIKAAAAALDRGRLSPRTGMAFGAGLVAAIIASGIFELDLADSAVIAGLGFGTLLFLVYKFAPLPKSWYDVLDSRLAAYEPVDEVAYAELHETTRANDEGEIELSAVFRWLGREYDAVQSCLPRRTAGTGKRFVSKDVPVLHIGALAESNAAQRELRAGQWKQVDLMADPNAVEHERRRAAQFYQLALEHPDKTASELAALLEAELPEKTPPITADDSTRAVFAEATSMIFRTLAEAHDFDLMHLSAHDAHRLSAFLAVLDQAKYPCFQAWPEKVFLSARLSCQIELQRLMQTHGINSGSDRARIEE